MEALAASDFAKGLEDSRADDDDGDNRLKPGSKIHPASHRAAVHTH